VAEVLGARGRAIVAVARPLLEREGMEALTIHGMVILELNDRIPTDELTEAAWQAGLAGFRSLPD
jgi:hypothetical protein